MNEREKKSLLDLSLLIASVLAEAPPGLSQKSATDGCFKIVGDMFPTMGEIEREGLKQVCESTVGLLFPKYQSFWEAHYKGLISEQLGIDPEEIDVRVVPIPPEDSIQAN